MSNKDSMNTIRYTGLDVKSALAQNPAVVQVITDWASTLMHSTLSINTECPQELGQPLMWSVSLSSPLGRRTYDIKQHTPLSMVFVTAH